MRRCGRSRPRRGRGVPGRPGRAGGRRPGPARRRLVRNGPAPARAAEPDRHRLPRRTPSEGPRPRAVPAKASRSGSPRRSCRRPIYVGPATSRTCCPGFTCRDERSAFIDRPVRRGADGAARARPAGLVGATTVRRLTEVGQEEPGHRRQRDPSTRRYVVHRWADGAASTPRQPRPRAAAAPFAPRAPSGDGAGAGSRTSGDACAGADRGRGERPQGTAGGRRSRTAFARAPRRAGAGDSGAVARLRRRDDANGGLRLDPPDLATGEGAGPGLLAGAARGPAEDPAGDEDALRGPWAPAAARSDRRRWVHETAQVLNELPPSRRGQAEPDRHAIDEADSRGAAEKAFDRFVAQHGAKHDEAAARLIKDRDVLLAFYAFPAEPSLETRSDDEPHRKYLRDHRPAADRQDQRVPGAAADGVGPVGSADLSPRDRPLADGPRARPVGRPSAAGVGWTAPSERLAQVIQGVRFRDGEPVQAAEQPAAA
jgi:hypothetical protein